MPIYVFSLGGDLRLTPYIVKTLSKSSKFPWNGKSIIFRDMDAFHLENYSDEYISGYQRYANDRELMETELGKAEAQKMPYVVFTNDEVVFNICRALTRKMYDNSENKANAEYGGWLVVTECDRNTMNIEFELYPFDKYGRLNWPHGKNNLCEPSETLYWNCCNSIKKWINDYTLIMK